MENNENMINPEIEQSKAAPAAEEKLTGAEKRKRWKEAKRKRKEEEKEYYRYAPLPVKIWNFWLKVPVCILLVLCLVAGVIYSVVGQEAITGLITKAAFSYYTGAKDKALSDADKEKIYELSPLDEEGIAKIDASAPAIGADETWTICLYIIGSDLEDQGETELSPVTQAQIEKKRDEIADAEKAERTERLERFGTDLDAQGLELPAFFYYPVKPAEKPESPKLDRVGSASGDLAEITSGKWSDNIRVVIQTGGARSWSNKMVNPNRTQRFLYEKGNFTEIENLPLKHAANVDTLSDFMDFCNENYHSDHNMLVLWDHGGGPFGYGYDQIFGNMMSIADIRAALEKSHGKAPAKVPYDIIGFDACLMAEVEVTNALNGYADYYCVSEEGEPGDGWDYAKILKTMTENPTMSAAQVGRTVADAFTDYYMTENVNVGHLSSQSVTFSVLDAKKAHELYEAYSELCKAQLKDAAEGDMGVLAEIGRLGLLSTRYGAEHSGRFNMADLGNYIEKLSASYPNECEKVSKLIKETVLYHRENGSLCDSTGIAVYLPVQVGEYRGLDYYLNYIYNISTDDNVRALYFYKQAGCLNGEMTKYLKTVTDKTPGKLDVKAFTEFTKQAPNVEKTGFSLPVSEELKKTIVDYRLVVASLDEVEGTITDYGTNGGLALTDDGLLKSDFDGKWPCINDVPLYVEISSNTDSATEYRSHINYNGKEAYMLLSYDKLAGGMKISGVRKVAENDANYLSNTRSKEELEEGAEIVPLYNETDITKGSESTVEGKAVKFKKNTKVEMKTLPKGYYLTTVIITDPRGDSYYSAVVGAEMTSGGISEWKADDRFRGSNY